MRPRLGADDDVRAPSGCGFQHPREDVPPGTHCQVGHDACGVEHENESDSAAIGVSEADCDRTRRARGAGPVRGNEDAFEK